MLTVDGSLVVLVRLLLLLQVDTRTRLAVDGSLVVLVRLLLLLQVDTRTRLAVDGSLDVLVRLLLLLLIVETRTRLTVDGSLVDLVRLLLLQVDKRTRLAVDGSLVILVLLLLALLHLLGRLGRLHLRRLQRRLVGRRRVVRLGDLRPAPVLVLDGGRRRRTVVGRRVLQAPPDVQVLELPARTSQQPVKGRSSPV